MFTIATAGTREGVIKQVKATKAMDPNTPDAKTKTCQKQIEAAKDFIISEIANLPAEFNGVRLDASGHFHPGGRTLQVSIVGQKLAL